MESFEIREANENCKYDLRRVKKSKNMYVNKKNGKLIKTKEQNEILENEFIKNPIWDLKKRKQLSKELHLSPY